jgi:hypothetical protein
MDRFPNRLEFILFRTASSKPPRKALPEKDVEWQESRTKQETHRTFAAFAASSSCWLDYCQSVLMFESVALARTPHAMIPIGKTRFLPTCVEDHLCSPNLELSHLCICFGLVTPSSATCDNVQDSCLSLPLSPEIAALPCTPTKGVDSHDDAYACTEEQAMQENYLNHQPNLAHNEAMAMQVIAKAADAFSAGDLVNTRIRTHQAWHLAPHAAMLSAVYPASYMRCETQCSVTYQLCLRNVREV